jgi:DNA-binding PucR family transcriptional regulator
VVQVECHQGCSAASRLISQDVQYWFATAIRRPSGSPEATRRAFNKRFLLDLAEDWQQHGREVFKRVRRESPASYLKVCAMLVPREMKMEHSGGVKAMTDEQIERSIELIKEMLAQREAGAAAKVIEGTAEPAALPAPRLMEADTAVGPKERKPRQRKMPPPASA